MKWAMIFDVDGVIADTERLNAEASVLMMRELYGVEVAPEEYREFVGTGDERYVQGVAEKHGVSIDVQQAVQRRKENFFKLLANRPLPAMPGVKRLVLAAREDEDARCAIATSGNRDKQIPVIEGTGLRLEWFDVVVTGEDVSRKKPDPQIYRVASDRLGVPPCRCVVFEDAPAGVEAAKALGMACVGVTSSVPAELLGGADLVVASLAELDLEAVRALVLGRAAQERRQ